MRCFVRTVAVMFTRCFGGGGDDDGDWYDLLLHCSECSKLGDYSVGGLRQVWGV